MSNHVSQHPVQVKRVFRQAKVPVVVSLRAYEVYKNNFGEQKSLIEGECRGGFSAGELIAFLYARSFPQVEWRDRMEEAFRGMEEL